MSKKRFYDCKYNKKDGKGLEGVYCVVLQHCSMVMMK